LELVVVQVEGEIGHDLPSFVLPRVLASGAIGRTRPASLTNVTGRSFDEVTGG
jgi:hypothetical protein